MKIRTNDHQSAAPRKPKGPMDDDLRFELQIGPVIHPTKRGKPDRSMPLLEAYEKVIEHMAATCDYENDPATVATLDFLEKLYTEARKPKGEGE